MRICFLDQTKFEYSDKDKYSPNLRGAETILINLSNKLREEGHDVIVYNNCPKGYENKNWKNLSSAKSDNINFDIGISNADINLFDYIKANKKYVISYSLQSIEKFIRKKQLFPYIKHKPKYILIGDYHMKNRSKLITLFGSEILSLAVDNIFINTQINDHIDPHQAIFTSRADRNSDLLIKIWKQKIFSKFKYGKLLITPNNNSDSNYNIFERNMDSQNNLIKDLLNSRVFLVPGHKAELYCLAAEEARELCVPIITLGIGSLAERVKHGITGFIAKSEDEFAYYTLEMFNNKKLWNEIRLNLFKLRGSANWEITTKKFLKIIT